VSDVASRKKEKEKMPLLRRREREIRRTPDAYIVCMVGT
jgi:hypothetical protein